MVKVDYRVTGMFGLREPGEIITALKIAEDPDSGVSLLFHPPDEYGCGSFEFGILAEDGFWVSCSDLFVNLDGEEAAVVKKNLTSQSRADNIRPLIGTDWANY